MSVQVLVKTTPAMQGSYAFLLSSPEERAEFVKRPDIWWYMFPEEDEDWRWHRGGAWKPAHRITPEEMVMLPAKPLEHPGQVTVTVDEQDEEEDDRW